MSASSVTKETVLPPHSPLSTHSHLSPRLLTPDPPDVAYPSPPGLDALTFTKQPIPSRTSAPGRRSVPYSPLTESEASDGHVSEAAQPHQHQPHSVPKGQHLSLLTAILSSPENAHVSKEARKVTVPANAAGVSSGPSNPPTTMSSPAQREPHGILQRSHQPNQTQPAPAPAPGPLLPSSILRRESADAAASDSTDGHVAPAAKQVDGLESLAGRLEKVEEKREKIGWADDVQKALPPTAALARAPSAASSVGPRPRLHFAVAHPPSMGSTSASEAGDNGSRRTSSAAASSRRPSSPFAKERKVQESLDEDSDDDGDDPDQDEEELDEATPGEFGHLHGYASRSTSSSGRRSEELHSPIDEEEDEDDLGYQEDEEDGMFSDEEETTGFDLSGNIFNRKFAFARPTNYVRGRRPSRDDLSPTTTPPPAPACFPPPNRRGRGHIRVADPKPAVETVAKKGCSRHCSPPPSASGRSRSGSKADAMAPSPTASPSARFLKRSEPVAGPSKQRIVGSPMPPRFPSDEDDDEDEDHDYEEAAEVNDNSRTREDVGSVAAPPTSRGGWRSDDAMFQASARIPSRAIKPFVPTNILDHPAPAYGDRPEVFDEESDEGDSVAEGMAREVLLEDETTTPPTDRDRSRRASEHMPMFRRPSIVAPFADRGEGSRTAPMPSQATVPPALDYTPVHRSSFSRASEDEGGLKYRLGKTLSGSSNVPSLALTPRDADASGTSPSSTTSANQPTTVNPAAPPLPEQLARMGSVSGRVSFQAVEKPVRAGAPQRAVSGASHYLANQAKRRESEQVTNANRGRSSEQLDPNSGKARGLARAVSAAAAAPIRCPKRLSQKEDLGWSDEALMSIRKQVGKGNGPEGAR